MTSKNQYTNVGNDEVDRRGIRITGVALVVIGLLILVAQYPELYLLGDYFVPALGIVFLIWGLVARQIGLLIPGGLLGGIGIGAIILNGPLAGAAEPVRAGYFLLAFAAGWLLISLLSPFTRSHFQWWPLVPGGVIALIAGALLSGETGVRWIEIFGQGWPLGLIALGLYMLLFRQGLQRKRE